MRTFASVAVAFTIIVLTATFSNAASFSETIGDDDNFGGWAGEPPIFGWDMRSPEEVSATNGAQFTDISDDSYQRTCIFDFGTPITNIIGATLVVKVHDLEDADDGHGPEDVDIQIDIEGNDVPGAFDEVYGGVQVINFDLFALLGESTLESVSSDGIVTVDFLNAGSYQEFNAIDYVC